MLPPLSDPRVSAVLAEWGPLYQLTTAELEIILLATFALSRAEIVVRRGVRPCTVKKQVQAICRKTDERSLVWVALRVLLAALYRSDEKTTAANP